MRPAVKPRSTSCSVSPYEAGSATRPPRSCTRPMCMSPFMKVPQVSTTALAVKVTSMLVITPEMAPSLLNISCLTLSCHIDRCSVFSSVSRHTWINFCRSLWARGLHMAGPFERLSIRNCRAVLSVTIPICPPRASISRTIWPLAMPPTAGLQLICAILFMSIVMSRVSEPSRAAAAAASQPAWPAPTTMTS